jgi:CheY-like chemotaxis protein
MREGNNRILVVDDSEEIRELFTSILEQAGHSVETASDGGEAFAKIQSNRPDLVLLDVVMPRMDGLELLLKVRSDLAPPVPPIILCSGFDLTEEEALRRGAAHFVRKPVEPRDLLSVVEVVLAGRAATAAVIATQRARVGVARQARYETARRLLQQLEMQYSSTRRTFEERAFEHVSGLARYLGVSAVALAFLRDDRLRVAAVSDPTWLAPGIDLAEVFPPARAVLETGSSLVLPDALIHPSFAAVCREVDGIRYFVGVPVLIEKAPIGVLCAVADHPMDVQPEDLTLVQLFGELGSAVLSRRVGRVDPEPPSRQGPGIAVRSIFEEMLDAELRLLDHHGGSIEVAVLDLADLGVAREALRSAAAGERLFGGALNDRRIAIYKRGRDGEARRHLGVVLDSLRARAEVRAVGVIDLAGGGLHPFDASDLVRLAELALDRTLETNGRGTHRLVFEERCGEA